MVLVTKTITDVRQSTKDKIIEEFTHMAFGTGSAASSVSDTALNSELVTKARQEYTELSNSVIISGFLGSSEQNGETIKEIGAKDAEAGNLQSHKIIDNVNKTATVEFWVDEEVGVVVTQTSS